jgi:hypothetical protein
MYPQAQAFEKSKTATIKKLYNKIIRGIKVAYNIVNLFTG